MNIVEVSFVLEIFNRHAQQKSIKSPFHHHIWYQVPNLSESAWNKDRKWSHQIAMSFKVSVPYIDIYLFWEGGSKILDLWFSNVITVEELPCSIELLMLWRRRERSIFEQNLILYSGIIIHQIYCCIMLLWREKWCRICTNALPYFHAITSYSKGVSLLS